MSEKSAAISTYLMAGMFSRVSKIMTADNSYLWSQIVHESFRPGMLILDSLVPSLVATIYKNIEDMQKDG